MPTVLRWRGYRFYFFSNEGHELPHIHVDRGGNSVKFWLEPAGSPATSASVKAI